MPDGITIWQLIKEVQRLIRLQERQALVPKAAQNMAYLASLINHYTLYMVVTRWDTVTIPGEDCMIIDHVKIVDVDGEIFFEWSQTDP